MVKPITDSVLSQRAEVGFHIGKNDLETKNDQKHYPCDKFPIHIAIDYEGEPFYQNMKTVLTALPKDQVKYRHENYYGTRFDIFLSDTEGVRQLLYSENSPLKDMDLMERFAMQADEKRYPHQIMEKAREVLRGVKPLENTVQFGMIKENKTNSMNAIVQEKSALREKHQKTKVKTPDNIAYEKLKNLCPDLEQLKEGQYVTLESKLNTAPQVTIGCRHPEKGKYSAIYEIQSEHNQVKVFTTVDISHKTKTAYALQYETNRGGEKKITEAKDVHPERFQDLLKDLTLKGYKQENIQSVINTR